MLSDTKPKRFMTWCTIKEGDGIAYIDKLLDKVQKDKKDLAKQYNVEPSAVVYIGDNKYIVCTAEGQEIRL